MSRCYTIAHQSRGRQLATAHPLLRQLFRRPLFARVTSIARPLAFATAVSAAVLMLGTFSFKKMERKFADVI